MASKTIAIDYSRKRLAKLADKFYNEGKYLSALRFAYEELNGYGEDVDVFARFADIYEGMGLHLSAINWFYRFLDVAAEEDLPDVYEGLAVNYLNVGNEAASAYYYNKLIDADASLPEETKMDIVDAFSKSKRDLFRFVYPPELADYSKEMERGSKALKHGDSARAIAALSGVAKGSKEYASAQEMQAVAYLLQGETEKAETICVELLKDCPNDVKVLATLAAVYLEQDRKDESRAIALKLYELEQTDTEELYKVATVCCENGLHKEAYEKFCLLEKKLPYDGRMLYFKGVAAFLSGMLDEAERTFDVLCTVYPDAEVAKYYLRALKNRDEAKDENAKGEHANDEHANGERVNGEHANDEPLPEPSYFYHLPQEEREERCRMMIQAGKCTGDEAQLFGLLALHDGYFRWAFDEMDGADHDLQYLALATAVHVGADEFVREVLLDCEVLDVLKIETLRMLYERNEDMELGLVLCHIYRDLCLSRIVIGRKKRKRFIEGYAKIASRFVAINDVYGKKLKVAAESLYKALAQNEGLDAIDNTDDLACAIFVLAGLKELGGDLAAVARALDANVERVQNLLALATGRGETAIGTGVKARASSNGETVEITSEEQI